MKQSLNLNAQYLRLDLTASGSDAAPVIGTISLVGNLLKRISVFCDATTGCFVRFLDVEHQVAPVTGYMFVSNSWHDIHLDREVEGPPWVLEVQAYNPVTGTPDLHVIVEVGDIREKDTDFEILGQLKLINDKLAIKR